MVSQQMFPCATRANEPDVCSFRIESARNLCIRQFAVLTQQTDRAHVVFGQFREMSRLASMRRLSICRRPRMPLIGLWCDIFKIIKTVVGSVAIDMVDLLTDWAITEKCPSDKLMDKPQFQPTMSQHPNSSIAFSIIDAREDAARTVRPSYATKSADFVFGMASENRSPFFVIHQPIVLQHYQAVQECRV